MDSYFVQCHQLSRPDLYPRSRPLAVQQHQDIIALNEPARRLGVRKHDLPSDARGKLAKDGGTLVHVPTDEVGRVTYRLYDDCSRRLLGLWREMAREAGSWEAGAEAVLEAHPSSKDEAWIDTGMHQEAAALDFARRLRDATMARLGFAVSVGLSRSSKAVAKLASQEAKKAAQGGTDARAADMLSLIHI